jgi:transposase-like protein
MGAELGHHLGYPAGAAKPDAAGNQRNGTTGKTVLTGEGPLRVEIPETATVGSTPS